MAEVEYEVKYVDGAGGEEEEEELKWIKRAGKAKVTYTKGDTYEGDFNTEKMKHGTGVYIWMKPDPEDDEQLVENARYEGEYKDGKRAGQGKMTYPTGDIYNGEWENNKMSGGGTYWYKNGDIFSGTWVDGMKHGQGTYEYGDDKSIFDGEWEKNKFIKGEWKLYEAGTYTGTFTNDKPIGKGTFKFENGIIQNGEYKVIKETKEGEEEAPADDEEEKVDPTWEGEPIYKTVK